MNVEQRDRWMPPNDRVLLLRAKLASGWSVRSNITTATTPTHHAVNSSNPNGPVSAINEEEQELIRAVIDRAHKSEAVERERIGRLLDRLNNIKRNAGGDGRTHCSLCNEKFHLFGQGSRKRCRDCDKAVCSKCSVDAVTTNNETIWFCKICSEARETWKKSNAWFLGTMPTFTLTSSASSTSSQSSSRRHSPTTISITNERELQQIPNQPALQQIVHSASIMSSVSGDGHFPPPSTPTSLHNPTEFVSRPNALLSGKYQNSTKILSASPVIRRKGLRSPIPAEHRNAEAFAFDSPDWDYAHNAPPNYYQN